MNRATAAAPIAAGDARTAHRPYEAVLAGQRVRAVPDDPLWGVFGQRRWRVTVTSPSEGLLGSFPVELAAQFGPAQLRRGEHAWQRVQALVAQQKAAPKELRGIDLERLVPVPQNALSRLLVGPKPQADVAAQVARQLGLAVTISKGADGTWRTVLERLPNNADGGRAWHALSRSPANGMLGVTQGELKLPANASPAFRQAFEDATRGGAALDLAAIALTLGAGAGLRPGAARAHTPSNARTLAPRGGRAGGNAVPATAGSVPQGAVQRQLASRRPGSALAGLRQMQAQGRPFTPQDLNWALQRDIAHHRAAGTLPSLRELHAWAQQTAVRMPGAAPTASPQPGAAARPAPAAPTSRPRAAAASRPTPHRGSNAGTGAGDVAATPPQRPVNRTTPAAPRHVYRQRTQEPQQAQPQQGRPPAETHLEGPPDARAIIQRELPPLADLVTDDAGSRWLPRPPHQPGPPQQGLTLHLQGRDLRQVPDLKERLQAITQQFPGLRVNLARADLRGVDLSGLDLGRADLTEANLTAAHLEGTRLSTVIARNANFERAALSNADLSGAILDNANLRIARLDRARLDQASLRGADLTGAVFNDAQLYAADLTGADLTMVQAVRAHLYKTVLNEARMSRANFDGANLYRAQMRDATVTGASFRSANLFGLEHGGSDLDAANVAEARNFDPASLAERVATKPRTPAVSGAGDLSHVPDLHALRDAARKEATPEFLQRAREHGLSYQGTGVAVLVRHGQSTGNTIPGGYFAGNGPNVPLTERGRQEARLLAPEMEKLAPGIDHMFVSPVDRAVETAVLATNPAGAELPPGQVVDSLRERGIGGYYGLAKPPGPMRKTSSGIPTGPDHQGQPGYNINPLGLDYVPPNDPHAIGIPRTTFETDGRGESWNQMYQRVADGFDRVIAPTLAEGKNVLIVSHQYVMGILTEHLYQPSPLREGLPQGRFVETGHRIPNATPQYWAIHVFTDAQGRHVSIPAAAGLGSLGPKKVR